jgi:hypothetical protein
MTNTTISTASLQKELRTAAALWRDRMDDNVVDMMQADPSRVKGFQRRLSELAQATGEEAAAKIIGVMPLALDLLAKEVGKYPMLETGMLFYAKLDQCWADAEKEMKGTLIPTIALGELMNELQTFYTDQVEALWNRTVEQQAQWRGRA